MFLKPKSTVVAHNGEFHADDVFAVATLSLLLEDNIKIIRTRDEKIIAGADYVVDVGGIYDQGKNRFDHHQTGGAGERTNTIPYASFGLVWKTFGEKVAGSREAALVVDKKLVSPIDALDNGVSITKEVFPEVRPYDISSIIGIMNPNWNEDSSGLDSIFLNAVSVAKIILQREIKSAQAALESEKVVTQTYQNTQDKRLIVLDRDYDWEHVLQKFSEPLYVLFPKDGNWRLKAVRMNTTGFENRKNLPAAWAGKRLQDLADITGVPDAVFCHNKLFLAATASKEGGLKLAEIALKA